MPSGAGGRLTVGYDPDQTVQSISDVAWFSLREAPFSEIGQRHRQRCLELFPRLGLAVG